MLLSVLIALFALITLLYRGMGFLGWVLGAGIVLMGWRVTGVESPNLFIVITSAVILLALVFGLPPLRRRLVSRALLGRMAAVLPRLGETERIALNAGTVWWDADLFGGRPDWGKLYAYELGGLSTEEQAFIAGPVDELCTRLDDWQIHQQRDLPPEIWAFLKQHGFFGMIIPKAYGGLEFSHLAHARVVTRIASRSITAGVTVMVPNSLGPAELLLHYGTEEQKKLYLPRLARGEEIPCFALTGPEAGSDAAATQCEGIVEQRTIDGKPVLGLRLNWRKRYITLAPVATLIGLAFVMRDPERLLEQRLAPERINDPRYRKDGTLGITCALIPRHTPGIEIGLRHDPMGVPFHNGPIVGRDVFVPVDAVIGGIAGAGNGWRMLMESLAQGRSISLPAVSVGGAQLATRLVGAYATVREQFDTPIGRFEGIEEPLARIGGMTYLMTAAQRLTCGALDLGEKPSVISAIVKCYLTEGMREVISDAMDVRAGAAIQKGPRNVLARVWEAVPIGITVEGANILTRSMIIYGQGAIRCHPFVQKEIEAVASGDVEAFDRALWGHVNHVMTCATRCVLLAKTGARLASTPKLDDDTLTRAQQHLSRMSAAFALTSDVAIAALGGSLKRREKISGRLADALGWLYLASAALRRYSDEPKTDWGNAMAQWSVSTALYRIQEALLGVMENFPVRWLGRLLKIIAFPFGARFRPPGDRLGARVARALLEDRDARRGLTGEMYVPPAEEPGLGRMEAALTKAVRALPVETKLRDAVRAGLIDRAPGHMLDDIGLAAGIITQEEYGLLNEARDCRDEVIQVDAFDADSYRQVH
jgi:acyl-CoA dehydrogenase